MDGAQYQPVWLFETTFPSQEKESKAENITQHWRLEILGKYRERVSYRERPTELCSNGGCLTR